eukprot:4728520-Amphidinium_carterae.1
MTGNEDLFRQCVARAPQWDNSPTTSLPGAIGKLTRIASELHGKLDKLDKHVYQDEVGGVHKNGWTDLMRQIWRRYRSYPVPSLGAAD